jgi:hypothetical protein
VEKKNGEMDGRDGVSIHILYITTSLMKSFIRTLFNGLGAD